MTFPTSGDQFGHMASLDAIQTTQMDINLFLIGSKNPHTTGLQNPSGSVSKLDLKAPPKARREYEHGYQLLLRKDLKGAVEHLAKAIAIYPQFVAAHNALGSAYLNLGKNDLAQGEFSQAVGLDDHLPSSYLNLGCADLALKDYPGAEEAFRKASAIAPLDIQLQLALAYGEFLNHDYAGVLATAAKSMKASTKGRRWSITLPPAHGRRKASSPKRNTKWRRCCSKSPTRPLPASFARSSKRSR